MSTEHEHGSVHRRDVICGGGGAVLGLMVATLLGGTKPVRAAGVSGGATPKVPWNGTNLQDIARLGVVHGDRPDNRLRSLSRIVHPQPR